jgi:hypothetical protein
MRAEFKLKSRLVPPALAQLAQLVMRKRARHAQGQPRLLRAETTQRIYTPAQHFQLQLTIRERR